MRSSNFSPKQVLPGSLLWTLTGAGGHTLDSHGILVPHWTGSSAVEPQLQQQCKVHNLFEKCVTNKNSISDCFYKLFTSLLIDGMFQLLIWCPQ